MHRQKYPSTSWWTHPPKTIRLSEFSTPATMTPTSTTENPTPRPTGNPASQTHRKKHSTPDNFGLDHASGPPSPAISFSPLSLVRPPDFWPDPAENPRSAGVGFRVPTETNSRLAWVWEIWPDLTSGWIPRSGQTTEIQLLWPGMTRWCHSRVRPALGGRTAGHPYLGLKMGSEMWLFAVWPCFFNEGRTAGDMGKRLARGVIVGERFWAGKEKGIFVFV